MICSTIGSMGVSFVNPVTLEEELPILYPEIGVEATRQRTLMAVPASLPRNSPSCHWRVSIHSGSWIRNRSASVRFILRDRDSRWPESLVLEEPMFLA